MCRLTQLNCQLITKAAEVSFNVEAVNTNKISAGVKVLKETELLVQVLEMKAGEVSPE